MRLFIFVLLMALSSGNVPGAYAQSTAPHSGFAVVTSVSGNVASLIASETLRNGTSSGPDQDILAPSPLITTASLLVPVGPVVDSTTAIALANPSTGTGSVNLVLTDTLGRTLFNVTVFLGPRGQFSKYLNDFFTVEPAEFSPALLLTISSEIPVGIVALNFRGGAFTSIPLTSLSAPVPISIQPLTPVPAPATGPPAGFGIGLPPMPVPAPTFVLPATVSISPIPTTNSVGGIAAFLFPEVATGGNWSTDFNIGNTSDAAQIVRIDLFNSEGTAVDSSKDIVVPPRGVVSFSADLARGL